MNEHIDVIMMVCAIQAKKQDAVIATMKQQLLQAKKDAAAELQAKYGSDCLDTSAYLCSLAFSTVLLLLSTQNKCTYIAVTHVVNTVLTAAVGLMLQAC